MRIRRRRVNGFAVVGLVVVVLSLPLLAGLGLGTGRIFHVIPFTAVGMVAAGMMSGVVLRRGPVMWYLRHDERLTTERILRASGFTSAWILDTDQRDDLVFVVAADEPGAQPADDLDGEPLTLADAESAIRDALPGRSVAVRFDSEGLARARLF